MKKITSLMMLMFALIITSCSDSDEVENLAAKVAGNYDGYTVAECKYFKNSVAANQSLTLTEQSTDNVTVKYTSDTWGTFTIENATVSGSNGEYAISGTGTSVMGHAGATSKEYDCTVSGVIKNGVADFTFTCPTVMGGLTITFAQGDIPAEIVLPGSYAGYTVANALYFSGTVTENETVTIAQNADKTYSVSYVSETWGECSISDLKVEYANGTFTLSGEGTAKMSMNGNIKEYTCTFAGTVDAAKSAPTFTFTLPTVMGGMTIEFNYGEYNG